jgi:NadR type nicotinamide-nucleotide adenylyltransferase
MSALVPTIGHKALVDFCIQLAELKNGQAHIIVGTQPSEPVGRLRRCGAFLDAFGYFDYENRPLIHNFHETAPQSPEEMPEGFWEYWRDVVIDHVGVVKPDDIFVASELYGIDMARILGCKFMPFNRYRDMLAVKGSDVRHDLLGRFADIMPEFQRHIRKTVTLFGPESCGKTTMAKRLAEEMNGVFVPEWAREYLETVGVETTDDRMQDIVYGQAAIQMTAQEVKNKPWIFQDTDLLSTVGYYHIYGGGERRPADLAECYELFELSKSDIYIVMSDQIPFEQDQLRYGGDKRESTRQFWIDLLEKNGCTYYLVKETDHEKQFEEIRGFLLGWFDEKTKEIREYVR